MLIFVAACPSDVAQKFWPGARLKSSRSSVSPYPEVLLCRNTTTGFRGVTPGERQ